MILVLGAGGNVGSAVVEELRLAGEVVRAAFHASSQTAASVRQGEDAITVDLSEPTTLPPAVDGADTIFLIGAMSPDQSRQEANIVEAAVSGKAERVVKLSVWRADEQLTPIARLHRPAEVMLERSGLAWTFLRPNFYMQNFSRLMAGRIRADGTLAQLAVKAPISFVDVRDVARVAARVLTSDAHAGKTYALSGPAALTYDDAAQVLSQVLERPVRYVPLSADEARETMADNGLSSFYTGALIEVGQAYRDGGADTVTQTVQEVTGTTPITFERFVRDHKKMFQQAI